MFIIPHKQDYIVNVNNTIVLSSAVYDAGGDKLLVQQLRDSCAGAAVHAAAVLTNMASQEDLRRCILAHGALPGLVELLHSTDNHTLISAVQAVASLTCDAEARQEVMSLRSVSKVVTAYPFSAMCRKNTWQYLVSGSGLHEMRSVIYM